MTPKLRDFRRDVPSERAHVVTSWLKGYHSSAWAKSLDSTPVLKLMAPLFDTRPVRRTASIPYWSFHGAAVERLVDTADVRVVCVNEDEDCIAAWLCYDGDVMHYLYVNPDYEDTGLEDLLMDGLSFTRHSHKCRGAVGDYNPHLAYSVMEKTA